MVKNYKMIAGIIAFALPLVMIARADEELDPMPGTGLTCYDYIWNSATYCSSQECWTDGLGVPFQGKYRSTYTRCCYNDLGQFTHYTPNPPLHTEHTIINANWPYGCCTVVTSPPAYPAVNCPQTH